ncbi:hypothetical protein [Klenkia brasiliensis]|uniref:Uncharacterized protein n=1 Tax=Klenkia brasiliensis TaxID=333142 RepID=A0A1G7LB27_9ACTN|nr:hypothetical protein [Klenkia brasiliensis]SDF46189.1 hypothetical protein SAMN05660324_0184 [Klenkia brasiliensis]
MSSDHDLDVALTAAAAVTDDQLPDLPGSFLDELRAAAEHRGSPLASVLAAGQLADDAHRAATRGRARRRLVRAGTAVLVAAAAWAAVLVALPADRDAGGQAAPTVTAPVPGTPLGLTLASTGPVTFPLSLDPEPPGLTPVFSQWGGTAYYPGPLVLVGDWSSAEGDRVLLYLFPGEPVGPEYEPYGSPGEPAGTGDVDGATAQLFRRDGGTAVRWGRPDGRWLQLSGEGAYADPDALLAVARSVVDRPQPVGLQFGLAPAGWTVGGYEESRSLDLVSDTDPAQVPLRVSLTGTPGPGVTVDSFFEDRSLLDPVEQLTVQGLPARLGKTTPDDGDSWLLAGQVPDGRLFLMLAPPALTRDQVLQIAEQITVTR